MRNKNVQYYLNSIKLRYARLSSQLGVSANNKQKTEVEQIIKGSNFSYSIQETSEYLALTYWSNSESYGHEIQFENGIARSEKNGKTNPLTPAIYALLLWNDISKEPRNNERFLAHAQYIYASQQDELNGISWIYEQDVERFKLLAPWTSAISQGICASVLLRAYRITNEKRFLDSGIAAIQYAIADSSPLRNEWESGQLWIEEYPNCKCEGVLNGYVFFLIAWIEYAEYLDDLWMNGIESLLARLPNYHYGKHLRYAQGIHDIANIQYQVIHYFQLHHLECLTQNQVFADLKNHWKELINWKAARRHFSNPNLKPY